MGGFTLIGSHYVFQNLPNKVQCRCIGFVGNIGSDVENILLNDVDKRLKLETLPEDLVMSMESFHLGEEMRYSVKRKIAPVVGLKAAESGIASTHLKPRTAWFRKDVNGKG